MTTLLQYDLLYKEQGQLLTSIAFFFALLIGASLAFLMVMTPFFEPILWATTLAVLFQPVQSKILALIKYRVNLAAIGTVCIIIITVIVPTFFLFREVAREGLALYEAITNGEIDIFHIVNWIQTTWPALIEQGERFGIRFDFDQATLKPETDLVLTGIMQHMRDNTSYQVELIGHTDNRGSDAYNMTLSQNRAEAVRDFLTGNGISPERIMTEWKGESEPVASNDTAEGRSQNRRVDILLNPIPAMR